MIQDTSFTEVMTTIVHDNAPSIGCYCHLRQRMNASDPLILQIGMKYEAILACEGLVINGTGHQILRVKKVDITTNYLLIP